MVMRFFGGLRETLRGRRLPLPHASAPFAVIGDIHGCADLLDLMLQRLRDAHPDITIVCVGDMIDRGPDSALVLARLRALQKEYQPGLICLMGNHEAMCLAFLDTPSESGPLWLRNGGRQTFQSFAVEPPADENDLTPLRDRLQAAMGKELVDWLRALPCFWQRGNVMVSHAGGDPNAPLNPRRTHGLLWGHPDTLRLVRRDGHWMVHGHYITPDPRPVRGRIPVDSGAFDSGILTAAVVCRENGVRFVQVRRERG